ncbi:FLX-like 1 protein [Nymphaea thermarum]|nr:FLX-like 1 protein [Nymphaea thermarum]
MSGRNRVPPHSIKAAPRGLPPIHDLPYGRGPGPMPHPALLEDMRDGPFGRGPPPPPHPASIDERLAAQHQEIQGLLLDNQRLAATHVALKQELAAAQQELQHMSHAAAKLQVESDLQLRDAYEKSMKMEAELRATEGTRTELMQVHSDIQKLTLARQELTGQVQLLTQDLARASADLQQVPAIQAEIESMKQELQRARAAIEYEKKNSAGSHEQRQAMEKNLISMAREVEKLRAEVANAEKRTRASVASAATGNPGVVYGGNYGNPDMAYGGSSYAAGYAINPAQGGQESVPQYGSGSGSWGAYDMQRGHTYR